ncbi:GNAT family N-acetyltransferase [Bosea psychrotolerans]|uniref:Acetyltransferase (GNAT) family protein n=1 Tax=Bosea psychrotolerans TaxID=1871628 RepID=A0A2S4MQ61_9HYPH|nr:GNAT family N-acetyltransferase [Bosea psychrotolerans]POR56918.1 acetyltransferase (GNAT) family protein [Bosea psychrotolerans]
MNATIVVRRIRPADYVERSAAFTELSLRALAANPHMAPAAIAAARLLVPDDRIIVLSAWQSEALGSERLAGLWALHRKRDWRSGFAPVLVAPLLPLYEVSSIPVLDRDLANDAAEAMLRHILASGDLPKTLVLPLLPLEGACHAVLSEAFRSTGSRLAIHERWSRPMLLPEADDDAERYLRRALGQSYKKRMQQFRAVTKAGEAAFRRERGEAAQNSFDAFLALEAAGWKGEAGTAIARRPRDTAYFRQLVAGFAAQDALQVDSLRLDGEPIAMGLLIESAGTRHFLKIAYDESRSRLSPGRALTIAMLQADFAGTPPVVFDSGAGDDVDAGTYVWGERREMGHAIVTLGSRRPGLPELAAHARQALRRLRKRLKG